jgi:A/G-specific adenine glycosylase
MTTPFTQALLLWYEENIGDLPWRRTRDPYAVWVSEIMAQQTRITALIPYYERFITLFPTVSALAAASEESVLRAWEGLGYYARARNLQKAAREIIQRGGQFPQHKKDWLALPGVGEYTAGAVLSIAFGNPQPAVDGNVLRVYARIAGDEVDVTKPEAKKLAGAFVREHMPAEDAGVFTQALMELGALVCLPKNPRCDACPQASFCLAYQTDTVGALPRRSPKPDKKTLLKTVFLLQTRDRKTLCRKRRESLLSGLWAFYLTDFFLPSEQIADFLQKTGFIMISDPVAVGTHVHTFTHQIWQMSGFACAVEEIIPIELANEYFFLTETELKEAPMASAFAFYRKAVLASVGVVNKQGGL